MVCSISEIEVSTMASQVRKTAIFNKCSASEVPFLPNKTARRSSYTYVELTVLRASAVTWKNACA